MDLARVNDSNISRLLQFFAKDMSHATNSDFIIPMSLHPNVVDIGLLSPLGGKDMGLENSILWQKLTFFRKPRA